MKKLGYCLFALGLPFVLLLGLHEGVPSAQAQQPAALVIEGGTVIDGNGPE